MTVRPLRPCAYPGCPNLVEPPAKYCVSHQSWHEEKRAQINRYYDEYVRDKRAKDYYNSPEWEANRLAVLNRDHYLCQECLRNKRITYTTTVHHIIPIRENWDKRNDLNNLEAICPACHNAERKKQRKNK